MVVLKRVDVFSAAKMATVLDAILGFIIAVFLFIIFGAFGSAFGASGTMLFGLGAAIIIVIPVALFIVGFVAVGLEAWIYNILAVRFGGIRLVLKNNQLKSIEPISAGRIAAAGGAIVGLIAGIIFLIVSAASGSAGLVLFGIGAIVLFTILFAIGFFIFIVIEAWLYNFIASKIGGVVIYFKGKELRRIEIMPYAKIEGVFGAIIGLIEGIAYSIRSSVPTATHMALSGLAQTLGLLTIIVFPILYAILTFVTSAVQAFLYNWLVPQVGGIKFTIS